jgi:6-phosphofructokinase
LFYTEYNNKSGGIFMDCLCGALVFAQSGGPTSVINSSALGVFETALKSKCITKVLGAHHGILGILNNDFFDINQEDAQELALLKTTPSSALGSVRYKLKDLAKDDSDYKRILEVFKKHNVRYFLYNGGNDSMDTCNKVKSYLEANNYDCKVIGVPKTIDNDLFGTDHCPGYPSAAKYIATSCMELSLDAKVYDKGSILILEIMGRNAGWLTASSFVASAKGLGPDLIYVPEVVFDLEKFTDDVTNLYNKNGNCIVAVSEGIHDKNGVFISEYAQKESSHVDMFNHIQLGGAANFLAAHIKSKTNAKVRAIEFSLLQRCAAHCASLTDVNEAYLAGKVAVETALSGKSGVMVMFEREEGEYTCKTAIIPLEKVANFEKKLPKEFITESGNNITPEFLDYIMPLIQGESVPPFVDGVPRFAKLKAIKAE